MLFTLVDPTPGFEVAYNRWYERDHFYGGVMVGPGTLSGRRWVATRALKDLRFPTEPSGHSPVTNPIDAGSFLATYFIDAASVANHFAWASEEVHKLYAAGRGVEERTRCCTRCGQHITGTSPPSLPTWRSITPTPAWHRSTWTGPTA